MVHAQSTMDNLVSEGTTTQQSTHLLHNWVTWEATDALK